MRLAVFYIITIAIVHLDCDRLVSGEASRGLLATTTNLPQQEIDALQDLYEETDGINWNYPSPDPSRAWNFTNPYPCQDAWFGVTCSSNTTTDGYYHVEQLNMQSYHMEGPIPPSFGKLTHLFYLEMSYNPLNGVIPESIGRLSQLQYIDYSNTELAGPFPDSFAQLINLQKFYMQATLLSGSLPESVCNCSALRILSLEANQLTGTLPACYGSLTNLTQLVISGNSLRGSIPESLGALTNLSYLDLSGCYLTGTLPQSLSGLISMVHLDLGTNKLDGIVPDIFTGWPLLQDVDLQYNDFTGTLPQSLAAVPRLRVLFVSFNYLRGPFPAALTAKPTLLQIEIDNNMFTGSLGLQCTAGTQLVAVIANNNYLTGTLPANIAACTAMTEIKISYNFLNGSIPDALWAAALNNVELDNNHLTGTISADVANLAGMFFLSLNNNELSGPVPDVLFEMPLLAVLEINDNFLTGTMPGGVVTSPALAGINIGDNHLTGPLPANVPTRTLQTLLCGGNALTGTIPSTFKELSLVFFNASANYHTGTIPADFISESPRLSFIYLSDNSLTGALPPAWGASTTTSYLYLDSNFFTGPLPPSLGDLLIMQSLNCSWNMLTGSIPVTFRNMTRLQVLLLQNNRLEGPIEGLFNITAQRMLSTIQLSSNQLTGPLPDDVFRLQGLNVFAAVSNCFEGSIPLSSCNSSSLATLALDGLHSASSCRNKIVPAGLQPIVGKSVYGINNPLDGGIPECLFQIPQLITLHLSGNGITGSLSDALVISPALQDLSLSHNAMTGTIPDSILRREWANLDLSYNRFSGTLDAAASVQYKSNASLSIDQNRLSGDIPRALQTLSSVSVLLGNMFACRADQSDLPESDNNRARYECGSDTVNDSLFVWIGLLAALLVLGFAAWKRGNLVLTIGHLRLEAQRWLQWSAESAEGSVEEVRGVTERTRALCRLAAVVAAYIFVVLGSVFAAATAYYGTYTFQYAWILSGAFLSGTKAFALMFCFLSLLLVVYYSAAALLMRSLYPQYAGVGSEDPAHRTEASTQLLWKRLPWYLLYLSVNFVIVVGVNIAFVLATLHENGHVLTFIQILLAVFKVGFNGVFAPIFKNKIQSYIGRHGGGSAPSEFAAVQLFVALFNNILIPCFVVAIISPSCFYNVFRAADKISAGYTYSGRCIYVSYQDGSIAQCVGEETVYDTTTYTPPFAYSYQCSSSFITYYAPAFVNMTIISAFIVPAMQVITALLHERATPGTLWFRALHATTSRLLISLPPEGKQTASYKLFDASQLMITLLTYLGLLLTFGALFPPLSLCFAGAMLSVDLWARLKVGRFLTVATEAFRADLVAELKSSCKEIVDGRFLWRSVWTILTVSALFYTLFLFDTLGDAVGLHKAYWVLIVVPLLPLLGGATETLLQSAAQPPPQTEPDRQSSVATEDPRLSEMEARASAIVEMGTVPDGLNDAATGNPLRRSVF